MDGNVSVGLLVSDGSDFLTCADQISCIVCADCVISDHRSMMETAYVYGSKYQFILITGGPVLKQLGFVYFWFPLMWVINFLKMNSLMFC